MADYRVTIVFDYTAEAAGGEDIDEDELHDAIMESFDTVDLEFTSNFYKYDENSGEVLDLEFIVVHANADNVREITIVKLES